MRKVFQRLTPWLVVVLLLPCPVSAAELRAQVQAVPTAKTLQLDNGDVVRLAAIQAPNRARDASETDDPLAKTAHQHLQSLALGKALTLKPVGDGTDRRGRILAMAYDGESWLQAEMLRAGLAWVYTFDDSREYAPALLAAEAQAQEARRGVWAEPRYAVLTPENAAKHRGEFRLLRGVVQDVAEIRGRYYLNFGEDWKTDFTLFIDRTDAKRFDADWLKALPGKTVRARGWLFEKNGPAMALSHPEQLEIFDENVALHADHSGSAVMD